jgi:hypothetical protein
MTRKPPRPYLAQQGAAELAAGIARITMFYDNY